MKKFKTQVLTKRCLRIEARESGRTSDTDLTANWVELSTEIDVPLSVRISYGASKDAVLRALNSISADLERHCRKEEQAFYEKYGGPMDYYFGVCPECQNIPDEILYVGRSEWVCCHKDKLCWQVGSNTFDRWRSMTEKQFKKNAALLKTYREIPCAETCTSVVEAYSARLDKIRRFWPPAMPSFESKNPCLSADGPPF